MSFNSVLPPTSQTVSPSFRQIFKEKPPGVTFFFLAFVILTNCATDCESQQIPPEVASNLRQWPLPNGGYSNTRAALNAAISSDNVDQLQPAWTFEITSDPARFGSAATSPLILDDTVYFQDLQSNVFAIAVESGEVQWQRVRSSEVAGPNGVAVGWGKVFGSSSLGSIEALNKDNGDPVWSVDLTDQATFAAPIPYGGALYAGLAAIPAFVGSPAGTVGSLRALNQETGGTLWNFDTVLSSDLWGQPEINWGSSVWYPPAVDIERGIVYAAVGNPYPWPGTPAFPNGSSRPGDNLYSNSIVALNTQTGDLEWFNQVVPHDKFDHDFALPPILANVSIDGAERDLVIGSGKHGHVVAFDRDSGQEIWNTPVGRHENDELRELPPGETIVYPGGFGGVLTPMAYADGIVYAAVINRGMCVTPSSRCGMIGEGTGELTAVAADTGAILWSKELNTMATGAATVVNDLVFTSTIGGLILALDRVTGEEVWSYQAPGGINAWPAVADDTIVFPVGLQTGREPPQLIAFRVFNECDFNRDSNCDLLDLNTLDGLFSVGDLREGVRADGAELHDISGDARIDEGDLNLWLESAASINGLSSPFLKGDANLDGKVAFDDFLTLADHFPGGREWSEGNFDGSADGVQFNDFLMLASNFGRSSNSLAIPEPSTLGLTLVALAGVGLKLRSAVRR